MTRLIAFLRAINVGSHTVKMDRLRLVFEELGLKNVDSFIASGNIVFDMPAQDLPTLQKNIETKLKSDLGYEVAAFLRTDQEVASIVAYQAFPVPEIEASAALNVAFLNGELDESAVRKLMALKNEIDDFHIHQREIYWLCQKKQSESNFSNAVLEKTLGKPATLRGINTIKKLAEKYPAK